MAIFNSYVSLPEGNHQTWWKIHGAWTNFSPVFQQLVNRDANPMNNGNGCAWNQRGRSPIHDRFNRAIGPWWTNDPRPSAELYVSGEVLEAHHGTVFDQEK